MGESEQSTRQLVRIKGIREGLLIVLGDGDWDEVQGLFRDHIQQQVEFLKGARLALDVGSHPLAAADLGDLRSWLAEQGLTLWAVLGSSAKTVNAAQALGLATRLGRPEQAGVYASLNTTFEDGEVGILVQRTLRSGYKLQHAGHVTVIGDVNPGAEIIAGGNVVVFGRLRGLVHAGAAGDDRAVVCALDLSPTQLRIAGQIAIPPKGKKKQHAEIAFLQDHQVVAEPWSPRSK
jgi:septum site-determining protein MinC